MKIDEVTEFWFDWGDNQQLTVHEGLAMATNLLAAGPLPKQIGTRTSTYIALGPEVPPPWLSLFAAANDPASFQVETTLTARAPRGLLIQGMSLAPCEHGEHLHASIILQRIIQLEPSDAGNPAVELLVESWRDVGDRMAELQNEWIHPYLDVALDLETLHGGT
ncbi:MAG: hypothetical protein ACJAZO_002489 [Myxococcota bacterium]